MLLLNLLALKRVSERPLSVALSVIGVASGVALAVSVATLLSSLRQSIDEIASLDPAAQLEITARSPLGFPERLAQDAAGDPDVLAAEPVLRQPALVNGEQAIIIGRSDVEATVAGSALLAGSDSPAELSIATIDGPVVLDVVPVTGPIAEVNAGRVVLMPLVDAQQVTGRAGVLDAVAVRVRAGTESAVSQRLDDSLGGDVFVAPADAVSGYALDQIEQVQQPVILMAGIALVAGAAMVFNTIQASARQRSRELAVLRAIGATKRQISTGLVLETVVLGLLGSALGLVGGVWLARTVIGLLPAVVSTAAGTEVTFFFDPSVIGLALAAGLGTALASAVVPIRRIARSNPNQVLQRRPPTNERRSRTGEVRTVVMGAATALAGVAMSFAPDLSVAQNGLAVLLAGLLISAYGLVRPLGRVAGALADRTGNLGALATATTAESARRVWAVSAAVFAAVALAITVGSSARNQVDTSVGHLELTEETGVWVTTAGSDDLPIGFSFPSSLVEEFEAIPGVESVTAETISYAVTEGRRFILVGVDGPASYPVFALAGPEVMDRVARGEGAVITTQYAKEFDLEVGDTVEIPGRTGELRLDVLAITRTVSVSNYGTVTIGRQHYIDALGDIGATGFQIFTSPEADDGMVASIVGGIAAERTNGSVPIVVGTGQEWFDAAAAVYGDVANVFLIILAGIVALAGLATLNATASSVLERDRQLGVLRALGATGAQVRRIVITEAGTAALVGAAAGVLVGMFGHWIGVRITNNASPFPTDYAIDAGTVVQALIAAFIAVAAGAIIPATRVAKRSIGTAMGYE